MSRGSTFALYRAYTKFKVPEETLKRVVAKGVAEARKELGIDASLTDCQLAERLPPILSAYECPNHVPYQIDPDPETVEDYRLRYHTSTFLLKQRLWCDRILSWNFGSMFDALIHHWGMGYYGVNTMLLVSEEEAKKILAEADNWASDRETKLVLAYETWG